MDTNNNKGKPELKIIPLGGTTTVQKNMYIYECGEDILVMDCGIGFPDIFTPGVDIIIPDFQYILDRREKVKGVVITHGHDDHRSSIPYLLKEYPFDIYAAPFVKALIDNALEEHTNLTTNNINAFDPDQSFQLGVFRLTPYRVNHSIPDTLGFAIDTPQGRIFHNSDYKFDWSPVMDKPFEVQKAAKLASEPEEGVLALLSDCLGVTTDGYSKTERTIQSTFEDIFEKSIGKQVFITTLSSNISRIQQAIDASIKYGRKVVISGRSLRNTMQVARDLNYISTPNNFFVDERKSSNYNQAELTYIITGSYGQPRSGLVRLATDEHRTVHLEKGAVIIFSADPIPNSLTAVNTMIDELYIRGAEIYYSEIQDNLHVSGHGLKGDMMLLANLIQPKYYIPIGGNIKHMRAYSEMIQEMGIPGKFVIELVEGQTIVFKDGTARKGKTIKLRDVYVDGSIVGDVGTRVLEDRMQMADNGMAVVVIKGQEVELVTRGFVFVKGSTELMKKAQKVVKDNVASKKAKSLKSGQLEKYIERSLSKFFFKETGREPLVVVKITSP